MTLTPGRRTALDALARARKSDSWVRDVLDRAAGRADDAAPDAAFARRLALGVVATQGALDIALDRYIPRPGDVSPGVRDALRLAAYEMLFEATAPHIAVDQGVEAAKQALPRAAGFANAVLRRLAEDVPAFPWGDPETDVSALALLTGHPVWMTELLVTELGSAAARKILHANNTAPPMYVAHNPFKGSMEDVLSQLQTDGAQPVPEDVPGCVRCLKPSAAARGQAIATGLAVVADAAGQLVCRLATPPENGTILDIGSGRGTKTLLLQAAAGGSAHVTAVDIHEFKVDLLDRRMAELGVPGVTALAADAMDADGVLDAIGSRPDLVLVDAPCSNLGTLRRHPEKRWRLGPKDLPRLAELGSRLLASAARLVSHGGFVVYSTCTIVRQENDDVVSAFLSSDIGEGFATVNVADRVPDAWKRYVTPEGWLKSLPREDGPDGHFAAVLRRDGD